MISVLHMIKEKYVEELRFLVHIHVCQHAKKFPKQDFFSFYSTVRKCKLSRENDFKKAFYICDHV